MPSTITPFTVLMYTPTKRKFKPLSVKKWTPQPGEASDADTEYSEWSGIHSEDDEEWPPLPSSLPKKPLVAQTWPKPCTLSSSKKLCKYQKVMNTYK